MPTSWSRPRPRATRTTSPADRLRRHRDLPLPRLRGARRHDAQRRDLLTATRRPLGKNYRKGINKGLLKIMSKMGISTITSYRGAQLFEIVGLARGGGRLLLPRHRQPHRGHRVSTTSTTTAGALACGGLEPAQADRARAACSSTCTAASTTPSTRTWSAALQDAVTAATTTKYREYARWSTSARSPRCATCSHCAERITPVPLDEVEPEEKPSSALRHRRHVARRALARRRTRRWPWR